MQYTALYPSPLGEIFIACDDTGLTGLWFSDQKYVKATLSSNHKMANHPILDNTAEWLIQYFSQKEPSFTPPLHLTGTSFQLQVWEILLQIPYGETVTYGDISKKLAKIRGCNSMSAQAVGGAVGRNPVSIIVPCHRVIGANGKLTGYAGGIDRKQALLTLENAL